MHGFRGVWAFRTWIDGTVKAHYWHKKEKCHELVSTGLMCCLNAMIPRFRCDRFQLFHGRRDLASDSGGLHGPQLKSM